MKSRRIVQFPQRSLGKSKPTEMTPTMVGRAAAVAAAAAAAAPIIECPICGEVSEQPYKNYGTKACYSCRAFFRRAHQKTRYYHSTTGMWEMNALRNSFSVTRSNALMENIRKCVIL